MRLLRNRAALRAAMQNPPEQWDVDLLSQVERDAWASFARPRAQHAKRRLNSARLIAFLIVIMVRADASDDEFNQLVTAPYGSALSRPSEVYRSKSGRGLQLEDDCS